MSAPDLPENACDVCGKPGVWHVVRDQGTNRPARWACSRHLNTTCLTLHPDPNRHHELTVTRTGFWTRTWSDVGFSEAEKARRAAGAFTAMRAKGEL